MKSRYKNILLTLILLVMCKVNNMVAQSNADRMKNLIELSNETFIAPYANAILLSPYEIIQHNKSRTVRNISMVDSIYLFNGADTIPIFVKDKNTIVNKPSEEFNSYTYSYFKDGRIKKIKRGRSLNDEFIYDKNGYLIQHGKGGELKKVVHNGKIFEWYKVNKNELAYTIEFYQSGKVKSFIRPRSYNISHQTELYDWNEDKVISKTKILNYRDGSSDTTYLKFEYDTLGLIISLSEKNESNALWSKKTLTSNIETDSFDNIQLVLYQGDNKVFSMTIDRHNNWTRIENLGRVVSRRIVYNNE